MEVVMMKVKAQGALEYLFMIAAALLIIALAIKYLKGAGENTGQTVQDAANNLNDQVNNSINQALQG
jgi:uncharacterized protein (UPF0333 family)